MHWFAKADCSHNLKSCLHRSSKALLGAVDSLPPSPAMGSGWLFLAGDEGRLDPHREWDEPRAECVFYD